MQINAPSENASTSVSATATAAPPGSISGTVRNASTGQTLAGVSVEIRSGAGNTTGSPLDSRVTASNGTFTFSGLAAGPYTIRASASTFATLTVDATVTSGQVNQLALNLSPACVQAFCIVLSWGPNPPDLDAHLLLPGNIPIFFGDEGSCTTQPFACLVVDVTSGFGPETMIITQVNPGTYEFIVHDFTTGQGAFSALAASGARVEIYTPAGLIRTFTVPNAIGVTWTVFRLTGSTITPVNTISTEPPSWLLSFGRGTTGGSIKGGR
jgi:uncharacterized protein YfaP (DUF2135 family)